MRIDLFTDSLKDGRIFQTLKAVQGEPPEEIATVIGRWVSDTREEAIKKALIELGWSPPGSQSSRRFEVAIALLERWNTVEVPDTIWTEPGEDCSLPIETQEFLADVHK